MKEYDSLLQILRQLRADSWAALIVEQMRSAFDESVHGDLRRWRRAIDNLPAVTPSSLDIQNEVRIGHEADISSHERERMFSALQDLHPWRKGPYKVFGLDIDTEWRSDWKWERVKPHIAPLHNRLVLDIGSGNGYHCLRMLGEGAKLALGIDPTLLSVMQFQAIRKLSAQDLPAYVLPLGIEHIPSGLKLFDTVFSMGVLYHRRSPIDHFLELKGCLRSGGEVVLETLVVEGDAQTALIPEGRYAQMRNVWFLPSCEALMLWMRRSGFKNVRLCDVTKTSKDEQRSTLWMRFNSLQDFLGPENDELTREGLPAPLRAIVVATVD